jgi:DeoR/GlpR family transcriptional regulator of sugar metabolism
VELEGTSIAQNQHYTVSELAKRWHLSPNTVRRLVVDEPGVIKLTVGPLLRNRRKRHLVAMRIPERVALGVHAKLSE